VRDPTYHVPYSNLNEAFLGRFLDVNISKSLAMQYVMVTPPFARLVDTANVAFVIHATYFIGVTNFGDYRASQFVPW
jgi:hypothetical protein